MQLNVLPAGFRTAAAPENLQLVCCLLSCTIHLPISEMLPTEQEEFNCDSGQTRDADTLEDCRFDRHDLAFRHIQVHCMLLSARLPSESCAGHFRVQGSGSLGRSVASVFENFLTC